MLAQWINGISEPETKNLMKFFSETSTNTRSENQDLIWDHISSISIVFNSTCAAWNAEENPMSKKYQSCNFTDPCMLLDTLKVMYRDSTTMTEMQDMYNEFFTPFSAFEFALSADAGSQHNNFSLLDTRIRTLRALDKTYESIQMFRMGSRKSDVALKVNKVYGILHGYTMNYSKCFNDFPQLMTNGVYFINPSPDLEKKWRKTGVLLDSEPGNIAMFVILRRLLIRLCLLFSLNNFILMFFNSNLASLIYRFINQICIILVFCIFPRVPFSIAFTFEVLIHFAYRKISGCACKIQKKFPILKLIKLSLPFRPRFDNMRMYKRRMRKVQSRQNQ